MSEALLQTAFDTFSAHIAVVDDRGIIVAVNEAWRRFARENGSNEQQVCLGRDYLAVCERAADLRADEVAAVALKSIRGVMDGTKSSFSLVYPCDSPAEQRWFSMSVRPMGAAPTGVVIAHENITEFKRSAEDARQSEEKFRKLFEDHSAIKLIIDPNTGKIINANKAAAAFYGWSIEELRQMRIQQINVLSPEAIERELGKVRTLKKKTFEFRHGRADGSIREVEVYSNVIDVAGKGLLYSIIHDITERKRTEENKEKLEARDRQLQKSESMGRMAAAIAHNFNNQLQAVIMGLEMAMLEVPRNANLVNSLTVAMQSARKAAEVSTLMLTYLGLSHGKREPLDLSEVCRRSLSQLRATMPPSIVLEADMPDLGPGISADAIQIQQILSNLVTNAWEAGGDGRGTIRLTVKTVFSAEIAATGRFPVDWQPQDKAYACLEVADAGCGIPCTDFDRLFDPFFSRKFTGRGLGLAVVLGIARSHNGAVTVESKPGRGSVFRVFFPVSQEAVPRRPTPMSVAPKGVGNGTVLVVEDEPAVRNGMTLMLKQFGFLVLSAEDGVEAVELFRQHRGEIGCVLCDLTMPRMNGWDTLAALRKIAPGIPVILVSGYSEAQVMEGSHPELPNALLQKPFGSKVLVAAINQIMTGKKE
jgi:PAS domain S-box-containing protein